MSASILQKPGTGRGPCERPCIHRDCEELRRQARTVCRLCGWMIGYGRAFYQDPEDRGVGWKLVHADCLETSVERWNERR
jgi:hypothetical protein